MFSGKWRKTLHDSAIRFSSACLGGGGGGGGGGAGSHVKEIDISDFGSYLGCSRKGLTLGLHKFFSVLV